MTTQTDTATEQTVETIARALVALDLDAFIGRLTRRRDKLGMLIHVDKEIAEEGTKLNEVLEHAYALRSARERIAGRHSGSEHKRRHSD